MQDGWQWVQLIFPLRYPLIRPVSFVLPPDLIYTTLRVGQTVVLTQPQGLKLNLCYCCMTDELALDQHAERLPKKTSMP